MEVLCFLDKFHANVCFPKDSNASFLAFIPKVQDPLNLNVSTRLDFFQFLRNVILLQDSQNKRVTILN